jgi:hypothetical protein
LDLLESEIHEAKMTKETKTKENNNEFTDPDLIGSDGLLRLPIPTASDGEAFRHLCQEHYDVILSPDEALEVARKVMGILYVQHHTLLPVCEKEFGGRGPASPEH